MIVFWIVFVLLAAYMIGALIWPAPVTTRALDPAVPRTPAKAESHGHFPYCPICAAYNSPNPVYPRPQ